MAFREACMADAYLKKKGVYVFSPIVYGHALALEGKLEPGDHDFWTQHLHYLLINAFGLIVLRMVGWESSRGITHEIDVFEREHRHIYYMDWDDEKRLHLPKKRNSGHR